MSWQLQGETFVILRYSKLHGSLATLPVRDRSTYCVMLRVCLPIVSSRDIDCIHIHTLLDVIGFGSEVISPNTYSVIY